MLDEDTFCASFRDLFFRFFRFSRRASASLSAFSDDELKFLKQDPFSFTLGLGYSTATAKRGTT